jgi:uncharacterized membrane protein YvbJ
MNYCPECGSELKEEFKVCPYCGFTLSSFSSKTEQETDMGSQKDKKIQELEEKIQELEKNTTVFSNFTGSNWPYFMVIFFFTGFFMIIFFIMFFVFRR